MVRESADGAEAAVDASGQSAASLLEVLEAARRAAAEALDRTPELLPVLADAGVVDAGGAGYLLLLDALLHVVDGRPLPEPPQVAAADVSGVHAAVPPDHAAGSAHREHGDVSDLRYEVMYFLEAPGRGGALLQGGVGGHR